MLKHILWALPLTLGCTVPTCPSGTSVPEVTIEDPTEPLPGYYRDDWGRWVDADGDCQDTRQEVLIEESLVPVTFDETGCRVTVGLWKDPYTETDFTDPSDLDIDHMVPLKEAHDSGAFKWGREHKQRYFNDLGQPEHLVAVDASANRSKGSRPPQEWMPPNEKYHCDYLRNWVVVKDQWGLNYTKEEALFIARGLVRCR